MEVLSNKVLEIRPDAVENILSKYNLKELGKMEEALNILREWINLQPHFRRKDFPSHYLKTSITTRKGSLERAKLLLDKLCTLRTLLPIFFEPINVACDLGNLLDKFSAFFLREISKGYYRLYFIKMHNAEFTQKDFLNFLKHGIVMAEYMKTHDYSDGMRIVYDLSDINVVEFAAKMDLLLTKQALGIYQDGYGMRLISFHVISESKLVGSVMSILKQAVSSKIASRIHVNKSISELYDIVDRKTLPKEYGGETGTIRELHNLWIEALSSEEHLKHLRNMKEASTDESLRSNAKFNEQYAGVSGTFRYLSVD